MGVKIDDLLPQLAVKSGHHRDDKNEDHHAEHHANDGNESNDGNERAFRLQITQGEKEAKWEFQIGDTVPANSRLSNGEICRHQA